MSLKKEVEEAIEGLDMENAIRVGKYMQTLDSNIVVFTESNNTENVVVSNEEIL